METTKAVREVYVSAETDAVTSSPWPSAFEFENWVRDSALDRAAEQISAGRKYRGLGLDELSSRWLEAVEQTVILPDSQTLRLAERNLSAEFTARGATPPYRLVERQRESIADSITTLLDNVRRSDPTEFEELAAFVRRKIQDFRSQQHQ